MNQSIKSQEIISFYFLAAVFLGTVVSSVALVTVPFANNPFTATLLPILLMTCVGLAIWQQSRRESRDQDCRIDWNGRGRFPLWMIYFIWIVPLVLGWITTFVSIHVTKFILSPWVTIPANTPLGLIRFVLVGIPTFVFGHMLVINLVCRRYPQIRAEVLKLHIARHH